MKVTRAFRGHRITLTDGEIEALELLVTRALTDVPNGRLDKLAEPLSLAGRRGLNSIIARARAGRALAVDVDRRKEK